MSLEADQYPLGLEDGLKKGWRVIPERGVYKDTKGISLVYMAHKGQDTYMPIAVTIPPWLINLIREEKDRERSRIQMGIKELLGIVQ
jgi:hypothetical protein